MLDDTVGVGVPDVHAEGEVRLGFHRTSLRLDSSWPAGIYTLSCFVLSKMKMVDKTKKSDPAPNRNEKPEICYCSALPQGSGLCLPCYSNRNEKPEICYCSALPQGSGLCLPCYSNRNEKPEICYCSALPKGSGLCLPCYTRWLSGPAKTRFRPIISNIAVIAGMIIGIMFG